MAEEEPERPWLPEWLRDSTQCAACESWSFWQGRCYNPWCPTYPLDDPIDALLGVPQPPGDAGRGPGSQG